MKSGAVVETVTDNRGLCFRETEFRGQRQKHQNDVLTRRSEITTAWCKRVRLFCAPNHSTQFNAQPAKIQAGQVHVPKRASWLGDFLAEV